MAQFDVYRNSNRATQKRVPYLLDVQSDLLSQFPTRIVVPLVSLKALGAPAERLHPAFRVEGRKVVMMTAQLAGIAKDLVRDRVTSLATRRFEIIAAIDFLISGI